MFANVFRQTYISNNYYQGDSTPPIGELSGVTTGEIVNSETITLSGWGSDYQSGLDYGQLVAYFNGAWHNLGSRFNPDFTYTWDFCNPELFVKMVPSVWHCSYMILLEIQLHWLDYAILPKTIPVQALHRHVSRIRIR